MDITSISESGPSTLPPLIPFPAPPNAAGSTAAAVGDMDHGRRSRSPPPSPHLPHQHLPTPGPGGIPATSNGRKVRSASPSVLDVTGGAEPQNVAPKVPTLCSLCRPDARQEAKYTCPRCGAKTCSVGCSRKHKEATGCSGERNKAAYVPMKEYGWGSMMSDYTFLEDIGRKVGEVGREIIREGYSHPNSLSTRDNVRGGARGRGMKRGRGAGKTKRDIWKMQMEVRDVDVDLLPLGMKRRKVNQSNWDFKNQSALLTLELKFYPSSHAPLNDLTSPTPQATQSLTFITHRTNSSQSLSHIIRSLVQDRSKKEALKGKPTESESSSSCPEWLKGMVLMPSNPPSKLKVVMRAPVDPVLILSELKRELEQKKGEREYKSGLGKLLSDRLAAYTQPSVTTPSSRPHQALSPKRKRTPYPPGFKFPRVYYALDIEKSLLDALRHTTFVEFPTIEVYDESDERLAGCMFVKPGESGGGYNSSAVLNGPLVVAKEATLSRPAPGLVQPQKKRRKLDPKEAKERIKGLIGDYGSDSDENETGKGGVASLLGEYDASDDEQVPSVLDSAAEDDVAMDGSAADGLHDEDAEGEEDPDFDDDEGEELDPAALLELVRQVKGEQWAKEQERMEDDALDWEGSDVEGEVDDEDEDEDG